MPDLNGFMEARNSISVASEIKTSTFNPTLALCHSIRLPVVQNIPPSSPSSETFIPHTLKKLYNNMKLYITHYWMHHICETSHPSVNSSQSYASLKKLTHHPYFESLASSSASLMEKGGEFGPTKSPTQAPNDGYGLTKILYVVELGNRSLSMVYLDALFYFMGDFITK